MIEALNNACAIRRSLAGSVFHLRPRQCVYLKMSSRKHVRNWVSLKSMGSVGTSADNAFASVV